MLEKKKSNAKSTRGPGRPIGRKNTSKSISMSPAEWEMLERLRGRQTRSAYIAYLIRVAKSSKTSSKTTLTP